MTVTARRISSVRHFETIRLCASDHMSRVTVIGLTGGIGSGKSTVAAMFARLGAVVVDADEMCHHLLFHDEIKERVRRRFGPGVFSHDGEIDRRALAGLVFKNRKNLKALTKILHPPVVKEVRTAVRNARKEGRTRAVVLDVVLLLESNMERLCNVLVFVETNRRVRAKRVKEKRGWDSDEMERREKFQKSINKKIQMADYVINNSLSKRETFDQVRHIWHEIFHEST